MTTGNRQGRGVRGAGVASSGAGSGTAVGSRGGPGAGAGSGAGSGTGSGVGSNAGTAAATVIEVGPPPTVLVRIRALLPTLPPSERRVAEAAIADAAGVAAKTISELAADCDTSETTVIR